MHTRRVPLALICSLAPGLLACSETVDRAAAHEHALIDHEYDRKQELVDHSFAHIFALFDAQHEHNLELVERVFEAQGELFIRVLEAGPPPGFGPSTCSFSSTPSDAEVFTRNLFGQWEYLGRTPLVVERPLMRAQPIEVRAPGYASASGYLLSDEVRGACEEHFELASLTSI